MFVEIYSSYFCRLKHAVVGSPDVDGSFVFMGFAIILRVPWHAPIFLCIMTVA